MKRLFVVSLVVALAALGASVANANYCARDVVPAATLLVPFAQVGVFPGTTDIDISGKTTLFTITNVSSEAQIVHITLWNMFSQHIIDFDVALTGYDVIEINLRDVLAGRFDLLHMASGKKFNQALKIPGQDYTPFELGPEARATNPAPPFVIPYTLPRPEDRVPTTLACNDIFASYRDFSVTEAGYFQCAREMMKYPKTLTYGGKLPYALPNDALYFYVTADVVSDCNTLFPSDPNYWALNLPTFDNVLIGDVILVDTTNNYSESMNALHIERRAFQPVAGWGYYQRYGAFGYAVRYTNDPTAAVTGLEVNTNLLFFKTRNEFATAPVAAWNCSTTYGFLQKMTPTIANTGFVYYAWDMDELPASTDPGGCPISPCPPGTQPDHPLPFETQRVPINNNTFVLSGARGWMLFALPASYYAVYNPLPVTIGNVIQDNLSGSMGWAAVQYVFKNVGAPVGFSTLIEGAVLSNAHCFRNQTIPVLGINFTNWGDEGAWAHGVAD